MHKLIPFGSLTALVIGVFVTLTVAGAFDDDNPQANNEGVSAAVCVEGVEDCADTIVTSGSDGIDDEDGLPEPPTATTPHFSPAMTWDHSRRPMVSCPSLTGLTTKTWRSKPPSPSLR